MEHHTYAKSGSKKWSAEEKRLLVTKRIEADDLFSKYSSKQAEPWKKFKDMANIGDFSERALRKQWLNMVQRYRVQKSNMQVTQLNEQRVDVLNEEWEFFGEIHAYMTQRTNDLHSYALKEPNVEHSSHLVAIRGVANDHNFCERSPGAKAAPIRAIELKTELYDDATELLKPAEDQQIKLEPMTSEPYTDSDSLQSLETSDQVAVGISDLSEPDSVEWSPLPAQPACSDANEPKASASTSTSASASVGNLKSTKRKRKASSEREKYYRHRRRYEHRMEVRLGGLCRVAGQILDDLLPGTNVTNLLMDIYNNVDYNCNSSCDDDDTDDNDDDDDDNDNDNNKQH